jgi:3-dehydroquinate synthetase
VRFGVVGADFGHVIGHGIEKVDSSLRWSEVVANGITAARWGG